MSSFRLIIHMNAFLIIHLNTWVYCTGIADPRNCIAGVFLWGSNQIPQEFQFFYYYYLFYITTLCLYYVLLQYVFFVCFHTFYTTTLRSTYRVILLICFIFQISWHQKILHYWVTCWIPLIRCIIDRTRKASTSHHGLLVNSSFWLWVAQ